MSQYQRWTLEDSCIVNVATGLVLEVDDKREVYSAERRRGNNSQKWEYVDNYIISKHTGMVETYVLDLIDVKEYTHVCLTRRHHVRSNDESQRWDWTNEGLVVNRKTGWLLSLDEGHQKGGRVSIFRSLTGLVGGVGGAGVGAVLGTAGGALKGLAHGTAEGAAVGANVGSGGGHHGLIAGATGLVGGVAGAGVGAVLGTAGGALNGLAHGTADGAGVGANIGSGGYIGNNIGNHHVHGGNVGLNAGAGGIGAGAGAYGASQQSGAYYQETDQTRFIQQQQGGFIQGQQQGGFIQGQQGFVQGGAPATVVYGVPQPTTTIIYAQAPPPVQNVVVPQTGFVPQGQQGFVSQQSYQSEAYASNNYPAGGSGNLPQSRVGEVLAGATAGGVGASVVDHARSGKDSVKSHVENHTGNHGHNNVNTNVVDDKDHHHKGKVLLAGVGLAAVGVALGAAHEHHKKNEEFKNNATNVDERR